jgi:hypothetical protein
MQDKEQALRCSPTPDDSFETSFSTPPVLHSNFEIPMEGQPVESNCAFHKNQIWDPWEFCRSRRLILEVFQAIC